MRSNHYANQNILVIGREGMRAKPAARQLKADGFTVRLVIRNVDADIFTKTLHFPYTPHK